MEKAERHHPIHYKANRGGHAPGYLREAFTEWLENGADTETTEYDEEPCPIGLVIGMLWNCTDILPVSDCHLLGIAQGSTYAQAVRIAKSDN